MTFVTCQNISYVLIMSVKYRVIYNNKNKKWLMRYEEWEWSKSDLRAQDWIGVENDPMIITYAETQYALSRQYIFYGVN